MSECMLESNHRYVILVLLLSRKPYISMGILAKYATLPGGSWFFSISMTDP